MGPPPMEMQSSGFQVFAPPGRELPKSQTTNVTRVDTFGFDNPIFPPDMLNKKVPGGGPSKDFEKIFEKVMNPSKY